MMIEVNGGTATKLKKSLLGAGDLRRRAQARI
jgi:hypothetical protein